MASVEPLPFGLLLKRHQRSAGLTQEELAARRLQHEITGLEPLHKQVLRLLGTFCERLYELVV